MVKKCIFCGNEPTDFNGVSGCSKCNLIDPRIFLEESEIEELKDQLYFDLEKIKILSENIAKVAADMQTVDFNTERDVYMLGKMIKQLYTTIEGSEEPFL